MRRVTTVLAFLLFSSMLGAATARADLIVATTTIATSGTFVCRSSIPCSGEGTNSITFGSGASMATLTFLGVNSTFDVTNEARPVTLGEFAFTASDGFTFPTHPDNPRLPILRFNIRLDQTAPVLSAVGKQWNFGPGGLTTLSLQMGGPNFITTLGPNPFNQTAIVYTTRPFPFTLRPGTTTSLTADVGTVPEPATLVLLGTGLLGAIGARRRGKIGDA